MSAYHAFNHTLRMILTAISVFLGLSAPVICIDPGHPSEIGMGTRGKSLTEVGVCWRVALALKPILEKDGFRVVLTKNAEREKVTNRRRAEIANQAGAALMLRLHCDAGAGSGLATYYPAKQGRINGRVGPSEDVIKASAVAARGFHQAASAALKGYLPQRGVLTDRHTAVGAKHGALIGSIYSEVPTVLVEMCKLQNPKDEAFLVKGNGVRILAKALASGVRKAVAR